MSTTSSAAGQPKGASTATGTGSAAARTLNFKLCLLGESAVGKSSIALRFAQDVYDDYRESTIGAAFLTRVLTINDSTAIKFEIWDTAGQERYRSLAPMVRFPALSFQNPLMLIDS